MNIFQGVPPVSLQGGPQKQQIRLMETIVPIVRQKKEEKSRAEKSQKEKRPEELKFKMKGKYLIQQ